MVLQKEGIHTTPGGVRVVRLCGDCHHGYKKKTPAVALANGNWTGPLPKQFADLTYCEKIVCAAVRSRMTIVHLTEPQGHKGEHVALRGSFVIVPGDNNGVAKKLPHALEDLAGEIVVVLLGSGKARDDPSFVRTMRIRKQKVLAFLRWLKKNNPDYEDIEIDEACNLPEDGVPEYLPVCVVED
ncbi:hypothetical protein DFJ74DRAFT_603514, partial [Hyaloraphidium curvatum]